MNANSKKELYRVFSEFAFMMALFALRKDLEKRKITGEVTINSFSNN